MVEPTIEERLKASTDGFVFIPATPAQRLAYRHKAAATHGGTGLVTAMEDGGMLSSEEATDLRREVRLNRRQGLPPPRKITTALASFEEDEHRRVSAIGEVIAAFSAPGEKVSATLGAI